MTKLTISVDRETLRFIMDMAGHGETLCSVAGKLLLTGIKQQKKDGLAGRKHKNKYKTHSKVDSNVQREDADLP